jgi:tetratricopeptide (TPR) repeat protein
LRNLAKFRRRSKQFITKTKPRHGSPIIDEYDEVFIPRRYGYIMEAYCSKCDRETLWRYHGLMPKLEGWTCQDCRTVSDLNEAIEGCMRRGLAWIGNQEYAKALGDFNEAIRLNPKESAAYNNKAYLLATCPEAKCRSGQEAVAAARKACDLSNWKEPEYIDALAAAYAEAGQFDQAIQHQQQALSAPEFETRKGKEARARLTLYQQRTPYHEKPGSEST